MTTKLLDTSMKSFEGSEPCGFIDRGKAYTLVSYRARMLSPPYSLTRAAGLTPYVRAFFHPPPTPGAPRRALYPWQGPSNSLYFFLEGVAEAALYCAHRTSTVSPCAFCEQKGHLAAPSPSFRFRAPWKGCRGRR